MPNCRPGISCERWRYQAPVTADWHLRKSQAWLGSGTWGETERSPSLVPCIKPSIFVHPSPQESPSLGQKPLDAACNLTCTAKTALDASCNFACSAKTIFDASCNFTCSAKTILGASQDFRCTVETNLDASQDFRNSVKQV